MRETGEEVECEEFAGVNETDQECFNKIQTAPLPGVKLPKSVKRWEEANLFFKIALPVSSNQQIDDIDSFTLNLQKTIYDYFAQSEGTINRHTNDYIEKYRSYSCRKLKNALAKLKSNKQNVDENIYVSHCIRKRIKPQNDKHDSDIDSNLKQNFWNTCKKIFNVTQTVLPAFDQSRCFSYFKKVLTQVRKFKQFKIPYWFPTLSQPSLPFTFKV